MASLRTQNALLFVIALCLVLIVVHLYSGHLVTPAQAEEFPNAEATTDPKGPREENPADPKAAHLYGRVCRHVKAGEICGWFPVSVEQGKLLIQP